MLLAEELLLLALDPEKGKPVNSSRAAVTVGMNGALIAELALDGRVELDGERFVPVGPAPGHPLLAEASRHLDRMRGDRKVKRAADQIRALDKALGGTWDRVVGGLVESRVLVRDRRRVLLSRPVVMIGYLAAFVLLFWVPYLDQLALVPPLWTCPVGMEILRTGIRPRT